MNDFSYTPMTYELADNEEVKYMYFKNCYWIITAQQIRQKQLHIIDHDIPIGAIIDFAPRLITKHSKFTNDGLFKREAIYHITNCRYNAIARREQRKLLNNQNQENYATK